MDNAIKMQSVSRHFDEVIAVNSLSLEINQGEVFGFLGHNGAGKTTTVRLLNGVLSATKGDITVLGYDPEKDGADLRKRTGVLTETPSLDERLTARENLLIYAELYDVPKAEVKPRIDALLEKFDLLERADEKAGGYSKGMKQRLALARALLHEPELLFLDEPTSGLDPVVARDVRDLIRQLKHEGKTILICTHNLVEAQSICDRVAVLEHGHLLAMGTPAELAHQISGEHLEIELEVSEQTIEKAENVLNSAGARVITKNRNTLHFRGINKAQLPEVVHHLSREAVDLYRLTPGEPTLEDVYFSLHGKGDAS